MLGVVWHNSHNNALRLEIKPRQKTGIYYLALRNAQGGGIRRADGEEKLYQFFHGALLSVIVLIYYIIFSFIIQLKTGRKKTIFYRLFFTSSRNLHKSDV
jgi:hypothetical protein